MSINAKGVQHKFKEKNDAQVYNELTRLEAELAVIKRNQEQILSILAALVSDDISTEPSEIESKIGVDNLTTFHRVDAIRTILEAGQHNQDQILSIIRDWLSDLTTEPPKIKILPLCIEEEIMKRLPVKSLVRFRSVSKSWKSLIDSSEFIGAHKNQPQHLLVDYRERGWQDAKYVCFEDNDSFPLRSFVPALPPSINLPDIVGSCYGLLCFSNNDEKEMVVMWNPSIRKSIAIHVPEEDADNNENDTCLGFGVCPVTLDPKILHITHLCPPKARRRSESGTKQFGNFWQVSVYKLSSGKFTNLSSSSNLPSVSIRIRLLSDQVVIDRLIYWCAEEDATTPRNLIMSFDVTKETFQEVHLPDTLASLHPHLSLSKLRESLVVFEYDGEHSSYGVWKMMDDGLLFTKLFTMKLPSGPSIFTMPLGFRKTGGPIISYSHGYSTRLVVYEPNSKHSNDLIPEYFELCFVQSYMETLLLIGRSDCTSF